MKHLINHRKEFVITIALFSILAYVLYDGFKNGREAQSIVEAVVSLLAWYYNMPTSIEGDTAKKLLKEMKETRGEAIEGEEPEDSEVRQ